MWLFEKLIRLGFVQFLVIETSSLGAVVLPVLHSVSIPSNSEIKCIPTPQTEEESKTKRQEKSHLSKSLISLYSFLSFFDVQFQNKKLISKLMKYFRFRRETC